MCYAGNYKASWSTENMVTARRMLSLWAVSAPKQDFIGFTQRLCVGPEKIGWFVTVRALAVGVVFRMELRFTEPTASCELELSHSLFNNLQDSSRLEEKQSFV